MFGLKFDLMQCDILFCQPKMYKSKEEYVAISLEILNETYDVARQWFW